MSEVRRRSVLGVLLAFLGCWAASSSAWLPIPALTSRAGHAGPHSGRALRRGNYIQRWAEAPSGGEGVKAADGEEGVGAPSGTAAQSATKEEEVGLPIPRSQAVNLLLGGGYAFLFYKIIAAEFNPVYWSRVKDTIGRAVPRGGLRVLEVGIAGAPNLEFYPAGTQLVGLDANLAGIEQQRETAERAQEIGIRISYVQGDVERMPFKDASFDAVIMTKVLCSVADPAAAVREVSRVLAPGGRFGYVEHVAAEPGSLLEGQQIFVDPLQQAIAGNCHLHRDTDGLIRRSLQGTSSSGPALFAREEFAERYQVWDMWPIAQQAAGVVTK